ncbi:hypothetical protein PKOR_19140 [Pontibacter korlensis]|uniref:Uncharacterized protein n=1 Tax=Pontibacter korlensis TaxID=400092 RepID=A0A0E3ZGC6_9BACT|nr:hypothetical protein PKOR_19140 [Pontibacter korlensis]
MPPGIADAFGKLMVLEHMLYLKLFNNNRLALANELRAEFMVEVLAGVAHFQVQPGKFAGSLSPVTTTFLFS